MTTESATALIKAYQRLWTRTWYKHGKVPDTGLATELGVSVEEVHDKVLLLKYQHNVDVTTDQHGSCENYILGVPVVNGTEGNDDGGLNIQVKGRKGEAVSLREILDA